MISPTEIVRGTPSDLDAIIELGRATYAEHFADMWSADGLRRHLDVEFAPCAVAGELASTSVTYLLAIAARLDGFAKLRIPRDAPGTGRSGAELQKIYVRRSTVGHGLGARLLAAAVTEARAARQPLLWLDVIKRNAGAIRFYQRHGFEIVGDQPFASDLGEQGFWVMLRELDSDPPP